MDERRDLVARRDVERVRQHDRARRSPDRYRQQNASMQRHYALHPEKLIAHRAVKNALRAGRLTRQPCVECGAPNAQAHHEDYAKPLDVTWLCDPHHKARHRVMKAP